MRTGRPSMWPLAGGLIVLGAAWLGPLPELSRHSFAAHMVMHMSVVAVAAPLIALGIAGSRLDPVLRWSPQLLNTSNNPIRHPREAYPRMLESGGGDPGLHRDNTSSLDPRLRGDDSGSIREAPPSAVLSPIIASVIEFLVVWAWHAPALHHAARHSTALLVLEQASFLGVGLLLWLAAFGGSATQRRQRAPAGIGGLLLTSMHMTLLGVLLALAARPLYPHGADLAFGLTALQDQHLGGVLMLLFGGVAYMTGALVLLAGLLRDRREAVANG